MGMSGSASFQRVRKLPDSQFQKFSSSHRVALKLWPSIVTRRPSGKVLRSSGLSIFAPREDKPFRMDRRKAVCPSAGHAVNEQALAVGREIDGVEARPTLYGDIALGQPSMYIRFSS
jgi:hypothetical protein